MAIMLRLGSRYDLTEARNCDVCDGARFEFLTSLHSPRIPDYAAPVMICRDCGFVTIRPRPNAAGYGEINARWYPFKFSADPPSAADEKKKFAKWRRMWDRIAPHYPRSLRRVLDVGAGQGWAIEFLKQKVPDLEAVAIEQWQPSCDYIRNVLGQEVVEVDINDDWPSTLNERFDLVIFRHTLEHLEEPSKALRQIRRCLAVGGYAYIVVPDAAGLRAGHPVRTDFLRPVHLHYFNRITLARLAARAGLTPHTLHEDGGEIWGLFRSEPAAVDTTAEENSYDWQKALFRERLGQARWVDLRAILRMQARRLLRGAPSAQVSED